MLWPSILILAFPIVQCANVTIARTTDGKPQITLTDLYEELAREDPRIRAAHFSYMLMVEGIGDRLYNVTSTHTSFLYSIEVSPECSIVVKSIFIMVEELAITEQVSDLIRVSVEMIAYLLIAELSENLLNRFCRGKAETFAANATLNAAFEKAKQKATKMPSSGRPVYYKELPRLDSLEKLQVEICDKLSVPEFARIMAVASFNTERKMNKYDIEYSATRHYLAMASVAVAKVKKYAESLQSAFMKAVNETIPEMGAADRQQKRKDFGGYGYWWTPMMMKRFYGYIAKDAALKKEVESVAAAINKKEFNEQLDFSKL